MKRYFSVDLGAESGRCIAGTLEGGKLILDELHRFPTQGFPVTGSLHWNIYRFYEEILAGLRKYVERYGRELCSVGVDAWGVDYGLLDRHKRLLGLPYCYRDSRITGTAAAVLPHKEWLYRKTGIQFLEINTLNQLIAEKADTDSPLDQAEGLLFIGDLLHMLLGASPACEYTIASISMLVNTGEKQWDNEIFERFGIPAKLQTPICFAGDRIGVLRDDIADGVGLDRGVRIIAPAVHDTASAALAIPAADEDFAYISSGTWSIAGIELDKPVLNEAACDMNISNSGGVLGKSLFLKNVMGLWIIQQCKKQWNRTQPTLDYDGIMTQAEKAQPFFAFIDPDDDCFFNPGNMPAAICDYLTKTGQPAVAADDIGRISRIVHESLALKYRYVLERIQQVTHKRIGALHIIGGGSKNTLLNTFIAGALNTPVLAGPAEGTAMGNLLMQAYGCGDVSSIGRIRQIVAASTEIGTFKPADPAPWQEAYGRFLRFLP
ncbi:MAG: rhamnulokinase [Spirochaetaceae bacterium]|jgi:rhamnulokinase|nr:rhamnulokinase [Spirochaetaceae bacterium]